MGEGMDLRGRVRRLTILFDKAVDIARDRRIKNMSDIELDREILRLHRRQIDSSRIGDLALIDEGLSLLDGLEPGAELDSPEWKAFISRYEMLERNWDADE
jgi:hypothetical protein